ncbi:MAG: hypothetical protein V2I97_03565 [Desulfococcaceae bacterium]|jgi:hypothetical protein|nr:hypothetical protein [Desulfococcaceae bacterium]
MNQNLQKILFLPLFFILFSCTTPLPQYPPDNELLAYAVKNDSNLFTRHAPVFLIENPEEAHNRIGSPRALFNEDEKEKVFVDPDNPAVYAEERQFSTAKGRYTNLIYRIHFEKEPFSLIPFHIGYGDNVGLMVIITLNEQKQPVLCTTVHTCGCYLAFVPSNYLPKDCLPEDWENRRQAVYSESLPYLLDFREKKDRQPRALFLIRKDTHRIKDIRLADAAEIEKYKIRIPQIRPLSALETLPLPDQGRTSFYETSGSRKDYVKGSYKPWERLLMSWWAFDWRIGEDKKYGNGKEEGIVFYTSIKVWDRDDSDMRDFAAFLKYWGWNL